MLITHSCCGRSDLHDKIKPPLFIFVGFPLFLCFGKVYFFIIGGREGGRREGEGVRRRGHGRGEGARGKGSGRGST